MRNKAAIASAWLAASCLTQPPMPKDTADSGSTVADTGEASLPGVAGWLPTPSVSTDDSGGGIDTAPPIDDTARLDTATEPDTCGDGSWGKGWLVNDESVTYLDAGQSYRYNLGYSTVGTVWFCEASCTPLDDGAEIAIAGIEAYDGSAVDLPVLLDSTETIFSLEVWGLGYDASTVCTWSTSAGDWDLPVSVLVP